MSESDEGPIFEEDLSKMAWMHYRVRDACEALCRYGGEPACEEFIFLLEELAELNYFISNNGQRLYDFAKAEHARTLLNRIIAKAKELKCPT
jgi:hypothetical protein